MNLYLMMLLAFLQVVRKVNGRPTSCEKHCSNVNSTKEFNTLVDSASKIMKSITQEAAGKSASIQVSVCIQSSIPALISTGTERPSPREGADVRPETERAEKKSTTDFRTEETPRSVSRDCNSLQQSGITKSGIYKIWPKFLSHSINVYCDMENNGGGWTVIQRRAEFEPHVNFYETWKKYREGFGDMNKEFWLGNDAIFALTNQGSTRLRIHLEDFEGNERYAEYAKFLIRSEIENYRMIIGNYEGTAGDAMIAHNDTDFSTKDRAANDCPVQFKGGWWYKSCHATNLNGLYLHGDHESYADGIEWRPFKGNHHSLKTTEMKIRPASC